MNNLWIFGCSISDDTQPADRDDYVKWKGYLIKTWSEILSKKIGYNLKNYAKSGTSNLDILESFSKHCVDIQNDDIVILNWTELNRFRIADKKWHNILAYHLTHSDLSDELKSFNEMNISTNTITEIIFNRENPLY